MDLAKLITRLKNGEQLAYKELVYAFSGRLLTVAKIYSKNNEDAKDVLQDAFILVFQKIGMFEGSQEAAFYAWMKRIVINLCLTKSQKMFRKMEHSIETMVIDKGVSSQAISTMTHQEIMNLVFDLPEGYRQVFALYAVEGYSHKEIADRLSIRESSSRSRYSRAKKMLQIKFNNLFEIMIA